MDVALLHNAKAGDETFTPKKLVRLLKDGGYKATYYPIKEILADKKLLKQALHGKKLVVVAGGDGSLRKAANRLAGSDYTIAALALGTANNIAHSLGITGTPEEIVASWEKAKPSKIDMGVAIGPWGKKKFIEGVGLGLIGRSIAIINDIDLASGRVFSTKEDKMHRDLCVMAALAHEMPPTRVKLELDGNKTVDDYLLLEVLNINRAGPGLELAGAADPSDGKLDLVWATAHERKALAQNIEKCLSESPHKPLLKSRRIRRMRLAVGKCELRLDDKVVLRSEDFGKWTKDKRAKIEIEVKPGAVSFLLPEKLSPNAEAESGKHPGRA